MFSLVHNWFIQLPCCRDTSTSGNQSCDMMTPSAAFVRKGNPFDDETGRAKVQRRHRDNIFARLSLWGQTFCLDATCDLLKNSELHCKSFNKDEKLASPRTCDQELAKVLRITRLPPVYFFERLLCTQWTRKPVLLAYIAHFRTKENVDKQHQRTESWQKLTPAIKSTLIWFTLSLSAQIVLNLSSLQMQYMEPLQAVQLLLSTRAGVRFRTDLYVLPGLQLPQINANKGNIFCVIAGSVRDYCLFESFAAQCGDNEVIMVEHASYGRMKTGRCISGEGIHRLLWLSHSLRPAKIDILESICPLLSDSQQGLCIWAQRHLNNSQLQTKTRLAVLRLWKMSMKPKAILERSN